MAVAPKRRARGANAVLRAAFEPNYAEVPGAGSWRRLAFVSSNLGEERGLIESDLLGQGREPYDPTPDVANAAGDLVVPVDARAIGHWLQLLLGNPQSAAGGGGTAHVFSTGQSLLPSMAIEVGLPDVPSFTTNFGVRANTMRIAMSRRGLLNATLGLIARGESDELEASAASDADEVEIARFAQATGSVRRDGELLGDVVSADVTIGNTLETVETIRPDGRIEDADPGMVMVSGTIVVKFAGQALFEDATGSDPIALSFGWTNDVGSLLIALPRVFLPRVKRPVTGPQGVQASFNFQASGQEASSATVTLTNDVAAYA